jgi:excisionase family DNA binding protein
MHRGVLLEVSEVAVLVATIEDLCRRTGRQPTGRLGPLITKLRRAAAESDDSGTKTVRPLGAPANPAQNCTYDLVSTSEAARILGISAHGVRDLVRRGQLPAHNTGTRWLLPARLVVARAERQATRRAG